MFKDESFPLAEKARKTEMSPEAAEHNDTPVSNEKVDTYSTFSEEISNLVTEKNRESVDKITVGSHILLSGTEWNVTKMDELVLSMENVSNSTTTTEKVDSYSTSSRQLVGNWKEQLLQEAGEEPNVIITT